MLSEEQPGNDRAQLRACHQSSSIKLRLEPRSFDPILITPSSVKLTISFSQMDQGSFAVGSYLIPPTSNLSYCFCTLGFHHVLGSCPGETETFNFQVHEGGSSKSSPGLLLAYWRGDRLMIPGPARPQPWTKAQASKSTTWT